MTELPGFPYETVVNRIATFLTRAPHQVDELGNLRDDYVSDLCIAAMRAVAKFKARYGGCRRDEMRYVYKALWNYAKTVDRDRRDARKKEFSVNMVLSLSPSYDDLHCEETRLVSRDLLQALMARMKPDDWSVLESVGIHGGDISNASRDQTRYSRLYFRQKVQALGVTAKTILQLD